MESVEEVIIPLHEQVYVESLPDEERRTASGIVLVSAARLSQTEVMLVLAVGTGEILYNGDVRKLSVEVGDLVELRPEDVCYRGEVSPDPTVPRRGYVSERVILSIIR